TWLPCTVACGRHCQRLPSADPENGLGTEVILGIKAVNRIKDFIGREAWILNMKELVTTVVHHLAVGHKEPVLYSVVVKFSTGISVGHRNLNRLDVQLFSECNSSVDRLVSLTGKSHNEVAVNHQSQLVTVLGEL